MSDAPVRELLTIIRLKTEMRAGLADLKDSAKSLNTYARAIRKAEKAEKDAFKKVPTGWQRSLKKALDDTTRSMEAQRRAAKRLAESAAKAAKDTALSQDIRSARSYLGEKKREVQAARRTAAAKKAAAEKAAAAEIKAQDKFFRKYDADKAKERQEARRTATVKIREAKRAGDAAVRQLEREGRAAHKAAQQQMADYKRMAGRVALGFGVGAAYGMKRIAGTAMGFAHTVIQETADAADKALIDSQRMAVTSAQGQTLHYASTIAGTEWGEVMTVMRRMADNVQDFKQGKGSGVEAIQKLGWGKEILGGKLEDMDVLITRLDKDLKRFNPAEQSNIMSRIGGRAGAKVLPLFAEGVGGASMPELRQEAIDLGYVIDKSLTDASQKWNDELVRTKAVFRGIRNEMARELVPMTSMLLASFRKWFRSHRQILVDGLQPLVRTVWRIIGVMAILLERVERTVTHFMTWGRFIDLAVKGALILAGIFATVSAALAAAGLAALLGMLGEFIALASLAAGGLGAALMAFLAPLGWILAIVAAIAALVLGFEDLLTFMRGGKSVMGGVLGWFFGLFLSASQAKAAVEGVRAVLHGLWSVAKSVFNYMLESIQTTVMTIIYLIQSLFRMISRLTGLDLNFSLGGVLQAYAGGLEGIAGGINGGADYARGLRGQAPGTATRPGRPA